MNKNKVKDERVVQMNNKVQSEAYGFVNILLFISIFLKSYILNLSFSSYMAELIIIVLSTSFVMIRSLLLGNDLFDNTGSTNKKKLAISIVLVSSIFTSLISGVRNYLAYSDIYTSVFNGLFLATLAITFISSLIFLSLVIGFIYWINVKSQERIDKSMNLDE